MSKGGNTSLFSIGTTNLQNKGNGCDSMSRNELIAVANSTLASLVGECVVSGKVAGHFR